MRHGKSKANETGIILSHPDTGITGYGLVAEGREQSKTSATDAKEKGLLDADTIIFSSDFARAKETAEILRDILEADEVILTPKLRERFFGDWENKSNKHYQDVWDDDVKDPKHTSNSVESTSDVLDRTTRLIADLESKHAGKKIVLVSHGDALQILQTAFENVSSGEHRSLSHLETAEIREITLN
jgi:glucosyl-3-phosphoglycerate phosphatase